jgi:hypothetical protein
MEVLDILMVFPFGVCYLVLGIPLIAFGMLLGRCHRTAKNVPRPSLHEIAETWQFVNKLSCLLTPRTPAPYTVYAGGVGFYVNVKIQLHLARNRRTAREVEGCFG